MLKFLPLVIVIVIIAAASGYFIFFANTPKPVAHVPQPALDQLKGQDATAQTDRTNEEKIQLITDAVLELKNQLDQLKQSVSVNGSILAVSSDDKIKALEKEITALQGQISSLKSSGTTAPTATTTQAATTSKSPVAYIPLGSGGQGGNTDWYTLDYYEIQMDPADYPGYTNMQLEVNFRLDQNNGTGYARLFNVTDNSDVGISVQTTTTNIQWYQSYFFKPASGKKTYRLQIKSATGTQIYVQNARIRVNF